MILFAALLFLLWSDRHMKGRSPEAERNQRSVGTQNESLFSTVTVHRHEPTRRRSFGDLSLDERRMLIRSAEFHEKDRLMQTHLRWYLKEHLPRLRPEQIEILKKLIELECWWTLGEEMQVVPREYRQQLDELHRTLFESLRHFPVREVQALLPILPTRRESILSGLFITLEPSFWNVTGWTFYGLKKDLDRVWLAYGSLLD